MGNQLGGRDHVCNIHGFGQDRRPPPESIRIVFVLPRDLDQIRCRVTAVEVKLAMDFVESYNRGSNLEAPVRLFEIEAPPALAKFKESVRFLAFSMSDRPLHGSEVDRLDETVTTGCRSEMISALREASSKVIHGHRHAQRSPQDFTSSASDSIEHMGAQCDMYDPEYCNLLKSDVIGDLRRRIIDFHGERTFITYVMMGPSELLFPFAQGWIEDITTEAYKTDGPRFVASMTKDWSPIINQTIVRDWACSFLGFRGKYNIDTLVEGGVK